MRGKAFFEKIEPDYEVKWVKLGNTAAIREAVLAGKVDAGFMGIPPFLIGADNGMNWKLVSGLSVCPVGLVADSGAIPDFESLTPDHRIALPQPGSIQHILLSMEAQKRYGDPARYDKGLVTMKHPDGMAALISGAVDAHFTSPPYLFTETSGENGSFEVILEGHRAFGGDFSFIAAMAAESLTEKPELLRSFLTAVEQSVDFINDNPEESAQILAGLYSLPEEVILEYITREDMIYTTELKGLERFISFMTDTGYLKSGLSVEDVRWWS
jgi:NitT/TauT family transport system substrate-binding protein